MSATSLQASIGEIVNVQRESPALPLTGGLGRDFFTIVGLGVLGLGMAFAILLRIRMRRREVT
ncbi:LPXTG cell wall anchor domain-containing protein [Microbacterium sp. F2E]|nr:LPXTG cell wall anchor domain-containing protein [Microbacterium sp. F2E]MCC9054603.1 LPXTG cell wall anchor domain-containing protein [Microbacterium sp. F2E]